MIKINLCILKDLSYFCIINLDILSILSFDEVAVPMSHLELKEFARDNLLYVLNIIFLLQFNLVGECYPQSIVY
jgi:hypothetical protein